MGVAVYRLTAVSALVVAASCVADLNRVGTRGDGGAVGTAGASTTGGTGGVAMGGGGGAGSTGGSSVTCPCLAETPANTKTSAEENCLCRDETGPCLASSWLVPLTSDAAIELSGVSSTADAVYAAGMFSGPLMVDGVTATPVDARELFVLKLDQSGGLSWLWQLGTEPACLGPDCPTTPADCACDIPTSCTVGSGGGGAGGGGDGVVFEMQHVTMAVHDAGPLDTRVIVAGHKSDPVGMTAGICNPKSGEVTATNNREVFAMRLDPSGCVCDAEVYDNNNQQTAGDLAVDATTGRVFLTGGSRNMAFDGMGSCSTGQFASDNGGTNWYAYLVELWAPGTPVCAQAGHANAFNDFGRAVAVHGDHVWFAVEAGTSGCSNSPSCGTAGVLPELAFDNATTTMTLNGLQSSCGGDVFVLGVPMTEAPDANNVIRGRHVREHDLCQEQTITVEDLVVDDEAIYIAGRTTAGVDPDKPGLKWKVTSGQDVFFDGGITGLSGWVARYGHDEMGLWGRHVDGGGADEVRALALHPTLGLVTAGTLSSGGVSPPAGVNATDTADGFVATTCGGAWSPTTGFLVAGAGQQTIAATAVHGDALYYAGHGTESIEVGLTADGVSAAHVGFVGKVTVPAVDEPWPTRTCGAEPDLPSCEGASAGGGMGGANVGGGSSGMAGGGG